MRLSLVTRSRGLLALLALLVSAFGLRAAGVWVVSAEGDEGRLEWHAADEVTLVSKQHDDHDPLDLPLTVARSSFWVMAQVPVCAPSAAVVQTCGIRLGSARGARAPC